LITKEKETLHKTLQFNYGKKLHKYGKCLF